MRIGCQIGIWKGKDVEAVARASGALGAAGIEVFTGHLEPFHSGPDRLKDLLASAGVRLSGAYYNSEDFINPEAEDDVVGLAAGHCACLKEVGAEYLVVNGGIGKGNEPRAFADADFQQFARVLNRVAGEARKHAIKVVVHPHLNCMVETPKDVNRLLAAGVEQDHVGLCVHASHQLKIDADPYTIYEEHAQWVRYVHVGDADTEGQGELLGKGVLDQERLMGYLIDAGFDGWVIIECSKEGVLPEMYAKEAIAYLKRTWPTVQWEA